MTHQLYKYFDKQEYAEEFLSGVVSMGSLSFYRNIEQRHEIGEARFDDSEGQVAVDIGGATSTKHFGSLIRVFCCSIELNESLKPEFGEYVVCITDADKFGDLLRAALDADQYVCFHIGLEHQAVGYRDEPLSLSDYVFSESQLFTKPLAYEPQREYRYAYVECDDLISKDDGIAAERANPSRRSVQLPKEVVDGLFTRLF